MIFNFYVSYSGKSGYGHLFRSMALELELRKRGHQCFWYKRFASEHTPDWWIVDTPKLPYSAILGAPNMSRDKTRLCYLGATGNAEYDDDLHACDLNVCQGTADIGLKDDTWLVGFEYALLWPGLHTVAADRERRVFVYKSIYQGMEDIVGILKGRSIPVLHSSGYVVRFDSELASSAVVITPWGMTSLEAMYLGIPQVAICFQKHARHSAIEASKTGAIHLLFSDEHAWKERAINAALLLLDDYGESDEPTGEHYLSMLKAGRKLIDGQGAMRVADALEGKQSA